MKPAAWLAIGIYILAYAASAFHLNQAGSYPLEEAITILVLLGFVFPLLAWAVTIRVQPISLEVKQPTAQALLAIFLTIGLGAYLSYSYLNTLIDKTSNKMEAASSDFLDILQEPTR